MNDIANEIRDLTDRSIPLLARMEDDEVSAKPSQDGWSKKEILGHLIDSAANNHQRFVRAGANIAEDYPTYNQNDWVRLQRYNESRWEMLVKLWSAYNHHLSGLIERFPAGALSNPCNIGKDKPVTLEFIATDYLRHLRHHIGKILVLCQH